MSWPLVAPWGHHLSREHTCRPQGGAGSFQKVPWWNSPEVEVSCDLHSMVLWLVGSFLWLLCLLITTQWYRAFIHSIHTYIRVLYVAELWFQEWHMLTKEALGHTQGRGTTTILGEQQRCQKRKTGDEQQYTWNCRGVWINSIYSILRRALWELSNRVSTHNPSDLYYACAQVKGNTLRILMCIYVHTYVRTVCTCAQHSTHT